MCVVGTAQNMVFNEELEEWEEVDNGSLFLKRFHGLGIADFKPGMGHTFLTTTILGVTAESLALGAYDFACPVGQEEACGYVQTGIVALISVVIVFMLSAAKPYLDGDDQFVEEVSAWCKVLTLFFVLLLPAAEGDSAAQVYVSWGIIAAQLASLVNQLWYNLKPLIMMIPSFFYWFCCPGEATEAEQMMDVNKRGSRTLGHRARRARNRLQALVIAEQWHFSAVASKRPAAAAAASAATDAGNGPPGDDWAVHQDAHKWKFNARNRSHERTMARLKNLGGGTP